MLVTIAAIRRNRPEPSALCGEALERRLKGPEKKSSQVMSTALKMAEVFEIMSEYIGEASSSERLLARSRVEAGSRASPHHAQDQVRHPKPMLGN